MSSVRTPALRLLTTRALALLGFGLAVDLSPAAASAAQPALRAPKAGDEGPLAGAKPAAKKGKGKGKAEPARPAGAGAAPRRRDDAHVFGGKPAADRAGGAGEDKPRRAPAAKPGSAKPGSAKPGAKPRVEDRLGSGGGRGDGRAEGGPIVHQGQGKPQVGSGPRLSQPKRDPRGQAQLPGVRPVRPVGQQPPREQSSVHKAQPKPVVDRAGTVAVGLRGGALGAAADSGGGLVDPGLGLALRVRPLNIFGIEGSYMRYGSMDGATAQTGFAGQGTHDSFSASGQLFLSPQQLVSPYLSLGGNWQSQQVELAADPTGAAREDKRRGLHGGLGLEVNLGQHASLGLELRYLHDRDHAAKDPLSQGQVQALGGLNLYF
ncbi:MAG: porin family protein [Deltaproteobacteria bacterium]|nr:porin family protein [Deltaproteobacteria bacterium]